MSHLGQVPSVGPVVSHGLSMPESESVGYLVDLLVEYGTKGVRAA